MTDRNVFGRFFQTAYVTRDLDAAMALFRARHGDVDYKVMEGQARPDGIPAAAQRIALTYVGDVMIELIQPSLEIATIYDYALPDDAESMCLHHLGYLIEDYHQTFGELTKLGYSLPSAGSFGDLLDYIYADTRAEFGHFSEFIRLGAAGKAMFDAVPRR